MKRRLFLTVLISAILAGGLPLSASAAGGIADVPADAWYAPAVTYCLEEGLMNGDSPTTFHPQETMSRAMFYQVLYNMTDHQPDPEGTEDIPSSWFGFSDVDPASWISAPSKWAYFAGLAEGVGENRLAPHQPIKREEMALLLYRYAMATGNDAAVEDTADVEGTSPWAQEAMAWAVEQGILLGDSGGLRPRGTATRAEAAQVLQRAAPLLEKRKVPRKPRLTETGTALGLTAETYPKVDGSTSTLALVQAAYEATHQYWAADYPFAPSRTVPSYEKLIAGEVDLILVPSPSQEVLDLAEAAGVELEQHKIALEALVFITPAENPTENITTEQAKAIYGDYAIRSWKDLGGPDKELVPLCRNSDSGSQSQLDNMILQGEPIHPDIQENYIESTMPGMLRDTAAYHLESGKDCFALGYTLYAYLQNHVDGDGLREQLKMLSYNGVAPTEETLLSGEYPLVDGYYAVLRADEPQGSGTRKLLAYLQGQDFAAAMAREGFFPVLGWYNS